VRAPDPELRWLILNLEAGRAVKLLTAIRRERPDLWHEIQDFIGRNNARDNGRRIDGPTESTQDFVG
jgi:hypothetical protein